MQQARPKKPREKGATPRWDSVAYSRCSMMWTDPAGAMGACPLILKMPNMTGAKSLGSAQASRHLR
eukprot:4577475-Prymnesium_polylepis.1